MCVMFNYNWNIVGIYSVSVTFIFVFVPRGLTINQQKMTAF